MKKRLFWVFVVGLAVMAWVIGFILANQGLGKDYWDEFDLAKVSMDDDRIPLIEAGSWSKIIEAQGYVVASERFFQMELSRRFASGRLAELFGEVALESDRRQRHQEWSKVADLAYQAMSRIERELCDAYAQGVNRFLEEHPRRIGVEFILLNHRPESWHCSDSLLVLLGMAKRLSSSADGDLKRNQWVESLPEDWAQFIYPKQHPWNKPLFGEPFEESAWPEAIDAQPLVEAEPNKIFARDPKFFGSNSWVVVDDQRRFLANDPHLGHSVPQIWYPVRLYKDKQDWVIGASIPGIPGVVIAMNSFFSWGFTNIGEDVESLVIEEVNRAENMYVESQADGLKRWQPLRKEVHQIKVKGAQTINYESLYTSRGPLEENPYKKGQFLSRQWLPLIPGLARIPTFAINRAKDWQSFNAAIDDFTLPGQNVVFLDRQGNIGYRASGRGLKRKGPSKFLESYTSGAVLGVDDANERRRLFLPFDPNQKQYLAIANQRIWVDEDRHRWASDDRAARIAEYLEATKNLNFARMAELHVDTFSKYHSLLRAFLLKHGEVPAKQNGYYQTWATWSGHAAADKATFTQMDYMARLLENVLLGRLVTAFAPDKDLPEYDHYLKRAWIVRLLEDPEKMALFGFSPEELATHLVAKLHAREQMSPLPNYDIANKWKKQHPFVGRIPIVGEIFRVSEPPQEGYDQLVRVEDPDYGASMRVIFDMTNPANSAWTFPVGQSGHVYSRFFTNFRSRFFEHRYSKLIPEELQSKFL